MYNEETAKELLLKADELISKAKELLDEVDDKSKCNASDDILAAWREHISTVEAYGLMDDDSVWKIVNGPYPLYKEDFNPYGTYPTEEYALMAQKMKIFNDKLLAFKWCYDRDYQPNWEDTSENKYVVMFFTSNISLFNSLESRFIVDSFVSWNANLVYFSTKDIAQKCADWLNSMKEKEN